MPQETTSSRPLSRYGPVQFGKHLGLSRWQIERAVAAGLLPPAEQDGKWPAAVVEDAAARVAEITSSAGALPDMGAHNAAGVLADRFGREVDPNAVLELARQGLLRPALDEEGQPADYKGHALYCGRTMEAFDDAAALERAIVDGHLHMATQAAA